jgi:hypothetical protein
MTNWLVNHANKTITVTNVKRMAVAASIYYIWMERNEKALRGLARSSRSDIQEVQKVVRCKFSDKIEVEDSARKQIILWFMEYRCYVYKGL